MKNLLKLPALAASVLVLLTVSGGADALAQSPYIVEDLHKKAPSVPEYVVFAGDTVRFERRDFYERMDRELVSFTYMHTNTTMMLKRSRRYFSIVEPILRAHGIPDDFKYLMAIESSLDPRALSPAGAAGMWQMIKTTAQAHGLEVNADVDERYNLEKETVAACEYLQEAYGMFGDWLTVAASYNLGQNGISRRIANQRQKTAQELWMPEETMRYIFRLLAVKLLFENPRAFGYDISAFDLYPRLPQSNTVTVNTSIASLVDFAEENGTTYARLKEANLWLRSDKLPNKSGKTYIIVIP